MMDFNADIRRFINGEQWTRMDLLMVDGILTVVEEAITAVSRLL